MNIFVAKLSSNTTSQDLKDIFEQFGEVSSAKVIMDRDTQRSKGYGFVEMDDDNAAEAAIRELNESEVDGRNIVVKKARPKE
ncbi:MAG: RNA-binding protein [Bacteroidota bacterium]